MPTFTPPTRDVGGSDLPGKKVEYGTPEELPLWRLFSGIPTAQTVVVTVAGGSYAEGYGGSFYGGTGQATPAQGTFRSLTVDEVADADYVYANGQAYTVSALEQTALEAAGYTVAP